MAAWALTIHKSQGMSLDVMEADLGPSVFAKGQAYVALSRARTLEGITLRAFCPMAIRADETVLAWYETQGLLSRGSVDEEPLPPPLPENLNRSIMRK
jgi:ATP-dependent exoDNAse (exonuclease V) alpha subunit